ncbi:hypothetical protein [Escherichia coli]|uniref:hypothetical protein n=1 Tax=Escherichia coli TaxID=562 RepID=UPI0015966B92|nr:hypothetical protein [Escherichia coli]
MRISNIEWLKKRIGFIRKLGEQTARQRQIIDLLDNEAGLTEQERKLLHVLATAEKNDLQAQESERKQAVQKPQNRNANSSTYWQQRKKTTYRHRRANENRRSKNESREKNNDENAITDSFSRLGY